MEIKWIKGKSMAVSRQEGEGTERKEVIFGTAFH